MQYNAGMRKTRTLALVLGLCATGYVVACSPFGGGGEFSCSGNDSCTGGANGVCEANGFCSFADPSCADGQRYADGPQANQCVGTAPTVDAGPGSDAADAATVDGAPMIDGSTRYCAGDYIKLCVPTAPSQAISLPATIDTGTSTLCATGVTDLAGQPITAYCVIAGAGITVAGTLATGAKPLVLISTQDIGVTKLDVSSHSVVPAVLGAGANPMGACNAAMASGNMSGGGGGGGALTAPGGTGGPGPLGNGGGKGATAVDITGKLRGGCKGADGTGNNQYGDGGGAVMLVATGTITIGSFIDASGAGGYAPGVVPLFGGAGGGSGGMIVLDAATITNTGMVYANGGGGAEGNAYNNGSFGKPGGEATGVAAAPGGSGGTISGGDGGDGGATPMNDGRPGLAGTPDNSKVGGGGGGGGSVGAIIVRGGGTLSGMVSPVAQ